MHLSNFGTGKLYDSADFMIIISRLVSHNVQ